MVESANKKKSLLREAKNTIDSVDSLNRFLCAVGLKGLLILLEDYIKTVNQSGVTKLIEMFDHQNKDIAKKDSSKVESWLETLRANGFKPKDNTSAFFKSMTTDNHVLIHPKFILECMD